jgi:hypothetical protein
MLNKYQYLQGPLKLKLFPSAKNLKLSQMPVTHACNPSYLRGRDWEDQGSKPVLGKNLARPYQNSN